MHRGSEWPRIRAAISFALVHVVARFEVFNFSCRSELERLIRMLCMVRTVWMVRRRCSQLDIWFQFQQRRIVSDFRVDLSNRFFVNGNILKQRTKVRSLETQRRFEPTWTQDQGVLVLAVVIDLRLRFLINIFVMSMLVFHWMWIWPMLKNELQNFSHLKMSLRIRHFFAHRFYNCVKTIFTVSCVINLSYASIRLDDWGKVIFYDMMKAAKWAINSPE